MPVITSTISGSLEGGSTLYMTGTLNLVNDAVGPGELRFVEDTDDGVLYTGFKAGNVTGNSVYTMPVAFPASNKTLQSTDAGVLTWESAGAGDVQAGSTFTTAGVILACDGDDKTIDEPGTTLTTNSQGLTVSGVTKVGASAGSGQDFYAYTAGTAAHIGLHWDSNGNTEGMLIGGADDHGVDFKFFGESTGKYIQWDMSGDELVFATSAKISFHDAGGDENILASADGHLEINAGTTLDITAPTVDINASTAVTIDGYVNAKKAFAMNTGGDIGTFVDEDTTPDVSTGNLWKTNTTAVTISDFDWGGSDPVAGQVIHVISKGTITYDVTSSGLKGGTTDFATATDDITSWVYDATSPGYWYLVQFMDVSGDQSSGGAGGGGGIAFDGSTANGILTYKDADEATVESNLTYDGTTITLNDDVVFGGGMRKHSVQAASGPVTANYTLTTADYYVPVQYVSGTAWITLTVPDPASISGKTYVVKNVGDTYLTGSVTISGSTATDTFDGATTMSLNIPYSSVTLTASGSGWWII